MPGSARGYGLADQPLSLTRIPEEHSAREKDADHHKSKTPQYEQTITPCADLVSPLANLVCILAIIGVCRAPTHCVFSLDFVVNTVSSRSLNDRVEPPVGGQVDGDLGMFDIGSSDIDVSPWL